MSMPEFLPEEEDQNVFPELYEPELQTYAMTAYEVTEAIAEWLNKNRAAGLGKFMLNITVRPDLTTTVEITSNERHSNDPGKKADEA